MHKCLHCSLPANMLICEQTSPSDGRWDEALNIQQIHATVTNNIPCQSDVRVPQNWLT